MAEDPFPRERVAATLRRMPAYLKLSWRLARDPLLSRARRATVIAAAGYLASPVDLVPGFIPVVGQLDDIAFAIAALKIALSGLDPVRRREHLLSVGLGDDDLSEDLRTAVVASAWLVRAGVRTTGRAAKQGGRAAVVGGRAAVTGGRAAVTGVRLAGRATVKTATVAATAASKAAPAARSVAAKASPAAKGAVSKAGPAVKGAGPAAKGAASRGMAAARGATAWRPTTKVRVSVRRPAALGSGSDPGESDLLPLEPDVIELPAPHDPAEVRSGALVQRSPVILQVSGLSSSPARAIRLRMASAAPPTQPARAASDPKPSRGAA